ncbi:unnamed protein product [Parajaminaea phylloscopi]
MPRGNVAGQAKSLKSLPSPSLAAQPLVRCHARAYHEPLVLRLDEEASEDPPGIELLRWFDAISTQRGMPWRKAWICPTSVEYTSPNGEKQLREQLEKRAYEVWISEIMLQQTRVSTVISYWNDWTSRWPTIHDLARASPDDVLSVWRGLGYYSRATRIHEAAKKISSDPVLQGLLPETASELERQVPGVGRYTAGAISSIVFGRAAAILDGNVMRVLSRQLAFHANPKQKATTDFLWQKAQEIVEAVAAHAADCERSDRPGLWNQALMELGSTVCTPQQPQCEKCPIQRTCRAFLEGKAISVSRGEMHEDQGQRPLEKQSEAVEQLTDIEDLCSLCSPLEMRPTAEDVMPARSTATKRKDPPQPELTPSKSKQPKQGSLLQHFSRPVSKKGSSAERALNATQDDGDAQSGHQLLDRPKQIPSRALETIKLHVQSYPMKAQKAPVREEQCVVCVLHASADTAGRPRAPQWLLEQRPDKGLLASLWEFPTLALSDEDAATSSSRKKHALKFARALLVQLSADAAPPTIQRHAEVGEVNHAFSHLKLKMHIHHFVLQHVGELPLQKSVSPSGQNELKHGPRRRWADADGVEAESMGTGMRNCWSLVQLKGDTCGPLRPMTKSRNGKR